jgi:hypothetical protein
MFDQRLPQSGLLEVSKMKATILIVSLSLLEFASWPSYCSEGSFQNGMRSYHEAMKYHQTARTDEDIKRAVQKYKEAIMLFEQISFGKCRSRLGPRFQGIGPSPETPRSSFFRI